MAAKSIKKNYVYTAGYQILVLLTPLITTPYISRVLEPDGIGYYSFYNSLCSYFVLFAAMGTTSFGQREVSFFQDDIYERSRVFWENVMLRCITSVAATAAWWICAGLAHGANKIFLTILSLNILGMAADITWFFQGLEEFGKTVGRSVLVKVLNVILIFLLVKTKDSLPVYALLSVALNLLGNALLWTCLSGYICPVKIKALNPLRNIKAVISLFIPSIAIQIYTVLDKTMIGLFAETSYENGYYEQAVSLSKMILSLVNAMVIVLAPRTGYYYKADNKEKLDFYMYQSYRFVWFSAVPLCFGLFGIAANFVPWFYGEKYDGMIPVLQISSILILAIGLNFVTGAQYLIPTQKQKIYTLTVAAGAAGNFIANLFLIPKYFALGAICASVMAETLIAALQFFMVRKDFSIKAILGFSWKYLLAGLAMSIVIGRMNICLMPSCLNTLFLILVGGSVYVGTLILLKDSFLTEVGFLLKKTKGI